VEIIKILTNHSGGLYLKLFPDPDWILHYEQGVLTEVAPGWTNPPLGVTENGNLIFKVGNRICLYDHLSRQWTYGVADAFIKDQFAQKAVVHGDTWVTSFSSKGLHRSTNQGARWTDINKGLGVQQCLSLLVSPWGTIYVGTFGFAFWGGLYETADTGRTWTDINPLGYDAYFINLSYMRDGSIAAGGSYGVFHSYGSDQYWIHADSITGVYAQFVSSNGTLFVGDEYNGIYVSTDNGWTWMPSNNGLSQSLFFAFGESITGRVFAAGYGGGVFYTDNNGVQWNDIVSLEFAYDQAFDFKSKGGFLFAGTSSGISVSHNNGMTWDYLPGLGGEVRRIKVLPAGEVLAAVAGQGVFISTDNGLDWQPMNNGLTDFNIWDIASDRFGRLFLATNAGVFFTDKFRTAPLNVPSAYVLEQNFPNPFNGTTTIRFGLPEQSVVTLTLYDILGQKVATILQESEGPGYHDVRFDASNLASGAYFIRLNAGTFTRTKKVLLIR
ncbi:MAG TPA: T9SS type A sorting domain-containing protein, partial [Bacteroidota bacterium]|nr:T9SS type A sorting domain-containing protein [Bacteroidota bacterium]